MVDTITQTLAPGALGMESGDISRHQLLMDSYDDDNPPWQARLNGDSCGRFDTHAIVRLHVVLSLFIA